MRMKLALIAPKAKEKIKSMKIELDEEEGPPAGENASAWEQEQDRNRRKKEAREQAKINEIRSEGEKAAREQHLLTRPSQLTAICTKQEGTFVYTPSPDDDPLPVGEHRLHCAFWPYESEYYGKVDTFVSLRVLPSTPVIKWGGELTSIYAGTSI